MKPAGGGGCSGLPGCWYSGYRLDGTAGSGLAGCGWYISVGLAGCCCWWYAAMYFCSAAYLAAAAACSELRYMLIMLPSWPWVGAEGTYSRFTPVSGADATGGVSDLRLAGE